MIQIDRRDAHDVIAIRIVGKLAAGARQFDLTNCLAGVRLEKRERLPALRAEVAISDEYGRYDRRLAGTDAGHCVWTVEIESVAVPQRLAVGTQRDDRVVTGRCDPCEVIQRLMIDRSEQRCCRKNDGCTRGDRDPLHRNDTVNIESASIERRDHGVRRRVALPGVAFEQLRDDAGQPVRHLPAKCTDVRSAFLKPRDDAAERRFTFERQTAGQHLEQQDAEGIEVAAGIDSLVQRLLRREIARGSDDRPRDRRQTGVIVDHACKTEVSELRIAAIVDEHVLRLQIAMHRTARMEGA
ncbi:MAG TPA: hypothetical protein VH087_15835 [Thermoanaerobaculia bacterium]|nr:hypothetical protein [Thermoanaerobaculia bacterium]